MMDHLGIQVADVDASLAFYLTAFGPLGLREVLRFEVEGGAVVGLAGPDGVPHFWLSPAAGPETRELHVAFTAPDRAAATVDVAGTALRLAGMLDGLGLHSLIQPDELTAQEMVAQVDAFLASVAA